MVNNLNHYIALTECARFLRANVALHFAMELRLFELHNFFSKLSLSKIVKDFTKAGPFPWWHFNGDYAR
jgi:hypothetical protein